ncbi:uncharacterized protein [Solanum tuberosum]|uniref:uncharacterized protein n=1 Tax=Solanum tuberosum TaxID=4113 RepID=UPI00073A268E|nr:PREDICTED: uncharacterized protein LOC107059614 [Solanum tuberosum]
MSYSTEDYARFYIREMVKLHRVPLSIISDIGNQFTSQFWRSFQKGLGTQVKLSITLHLQTDGQACKISTRHAHGCDEESNNGLGNNVDNFRKWVDVVERVVTILKTDMRDLKGKALIHNSEMAMLAESIVITNEEDNEDTTEMQQDMKASLRTTHSQGDKTESSVPFKHRDDDTSDEIEAGYKEEDIE